MEVEPWAGSVKRDLRGLSGAGGGKRLDTPRAVGRVPVPQLGEPVPGPTRSKSRPTVSGADTAVAVGLSEKAVETRVLNGEMMRDVLRRPRPHFAPPVPTEATVSHPSLYPRNMRRMQTMRHGRACAGKGLFEALAGQG